MTLQELSQLYWLNREIEMDYRRLKELEARAMPGTQSFAGVSGCSGGSKVEAVAVEVADLRATIQDKQRRCIAERQRLEEYIADIPDSWLRQVFALRFINGLSWRQVAAHMGRGDAEEAVKRACYRFLRKSESCPECPEHMC